MVAYAAAVELLIMDMRVLRRRSLVMQLSPDQYEINPRVLRVKRKYPLGLRIFLLQGVQGSTSNRYRSRRAVTKLEDDASGQSGSASIAQSSLVCSVQRFGVVIRHSLRSDCSRWPVWNSLLRRLVYCCEY